jgi:transcriptional regulator with XRE-family HTH domain
VTDEHSEVGALVRAARLSRRLTLGDIADRSGLSQSFLSQFERGQTDASIASLRGIATAIGISLGELFEPNGTAGVRVLRNSARPRLPYGHRAEKFLLTANPLQNIEVFTAVFQDGGTTGDGQYTHGDSDELVLVQYGSVTLELGQDVFLLRAGDSIVFRSSTPHRLANAVHEESSILWIISPPTQ